MTESSTTAARINPEHKIPTGLCPPDEATRPDVSYSKVIREDPVAPPDTLLENTELRLGSGPIPASRYYSREFHDLERERLWPKVWQFACWGYDICNPGDVYVYRIIDRSVLIVRQPDGSLKALINACLHRGRELCEQSGRVNQLRCPYHSFTWNLDGSLKWTPSKWDFPQVTPDNFRLPEIRIEEWNGFVFVNFDPNAPPLTHYMGRMVKDWERWQFDKRYKAVHVRKRINCNWKTCQDAFIEGFHSYSSHPQFIPTVPDDCGQQDVFSDEPHYSRMMHPVGIPSPRLRPIPTDQQNFEALCRNFLPEAIGTEEGKLKAEESVRGGIARIARKAYMKNFGVDTSWLSTTEEIDPIAYFIFPNLMPWPSMSFPLVYHFRPESAPDWCTWDTMLLVPFSGPRPPSAPIIQIGPDDSFAKVAALGSLGLVLQQDAQHLPAVQRGMKNLRDGLVSPSEYSEVRIRHYHKTLEAYLNI
jgi:phenylpropionate dioxygenase-like ring-hydroxylating dioxygenase large terminal subunit